MFITTFYIVFVAIVDWQISFPLVLLFGAVYGVIDGAFFTANLTKVRPGAGGRANGATPTLCARGSSSLGQPQPHATRGPTCCPVFCPFAMWRAAADAPARRHGAR